jgi:hypothetical protein
VEADRRAGPPLLETIARTLFTHDAAGRIVRVNEPDGPAAPRLYVLWDGAAWLWRLRDDLPAALVSRLAALRAGHAVPTDLETLPGVTAELCAALSEHAPVTGEIVGDFEYRFPDDRDPRGGAFAAGGDRAAEVAGAGAVVAVTADNADVLARWLPAWRSYASSGLPMTAVLVDGAAAAVCASVRFPGDATEAGVETHPAFRGRGHAATATAAWARAVRARGILPLYGTSWRNLASQRVAAKLGLVRAAASFAIA